jgi:hypothetical protein
VLDAKNLKTLYAFKKNWIKNKIQGGEKSGKFAHIPGAGK